MKQPWEILKLLADSTRLRLLCLLQREELSVAEIQEILDMAQSRISSQLALLRKADLVVDRREGKNSFYSINPDLAQKEKELIETTIAPASWAITGTGGQGNIAIFNRSMVIHATIDVHEQIAGWFAFGA